MSVFPPDIAEKMKNSGSEWLGGSDFEGEGLTLQIVSVMPVDSQYGAAEDDYWVEQDILKQGQTFRYTFKDNEGAEKKWDTHSRPLAIGLQQSEVEAGDWIHITRTGTGKNTRYAAVKVDAPVSHAKPDPNPEEIPF